MPPDFCASAGSASAIPSSIPPIVANNRAVRLILNPPIPRVCPVLLRRLEGERERHGFARIHRRDNYEQPGPDPLFRCTAPLDPAARQDHRDGRRLVELEPPE